MTVLGDELKEIDAALARIEDGGYGLCTGCGDAIALERLRVLPFAELCIECKQAQEAGQ